MASAALKQEDPGTPIPGEELPANNDGDGGTQVVERDYEAEARERGWVPAEEFKGDSSRCVDAKTFVDRTDTMMPLLKADRDRLRRELADMKKDLRKFGDFASKAEERAYERAVADLTARQEQAVADGDLKAHRAVGAELDKLRADAPTATPAVSREEAEGAFTDWREENPWFDRANLAGATDLEKDARIYADLMTEKNLGKTTTMPPAEFFAYIGGLVHEKFPALKAKPVREKPPSDVGAPTTNRARPGGHSWSDITDPELRRQAERMAEKWAKSGLLPNKDAYLKSFDWSKV